MGGRIPTRSARKRSASTSLNGCPCRAMRTPQSGTRGGRRVTLTLSEDEGRLVLKVVDDGSGLPSDATARTESESLLPGFTVARC